MYKSDIPNRLAEIKRLSTLAAGIAPARKGEPPTLTDKDLEMIEELLNRLTALAKEVVEWVAQPEALLADGPLQSCEKEVLEALSNLGCSRQNAEAALRKAKAALGNNAGFEPLFRRALEFVR